MIRILLALCVAVAVVSQAAAQPAPAANRSEIIKKKIRSLRAYALTEELALDEATAGKLFPMLAKWDDVTDKLLTQRVTLTAQLRGADQLKDPKAVDKLIEDAIANQKAFRELEDRRLAELRKILSPGQTARLLVVLPEFERRIQNQLRRVIQKQGKRAGRAKRRDDVRDAGDDDDGDDGDAELPGPQTPRSGPAQRAPVPAAGTPKCDPFSTVRGCAPTRR
ncbi:hypothetical protein BH11MYX3_BH11MYX3_04130 [soil metagenome]